MLQLILEVTLSMLTVYGVYCMIINITYIAFARISRACVLHFSKVGIAILFLIFYLQKKHLWGELAR